jgi:uncharacterized protein YjbK
MKENEYKFLLPKDDYDNALEKAKGRFFQINLAEKIQVNYYYDTSNNDLQKNNTTLRVRQIENNLKLEIKILEKTQNEFRCSDEISYPAEIIQDTISLPHEIRRRPYLCNVYSLQGCLVTHRTSIVLSNQIRVDFDRNMYLGVCDYEIEIEFEPTSDNIREVKNIIDALNLGCSVNIVSKSERFFKQRSIVKNVTA